MKKVTYCGLLSSARFFFPGVAAIMAEISWMHQEAILAYRLTEMNLTTMQIGLFFTIYPISYILYCGVVSQFISPKVDKRVIMLVASLINFAAFALVGPSLLLHFPDSIVLMCAG